MSKPPREIDSAKVLHWAWSGSHPFGTVNYLNGQIAAEIYGLAICQYAKSDVIHRFSCNKSWGTEQDQDYISVKQAKDELPVQYRNAPVEWIKYE